MIKILVAADMEGISGVVHSDQTDARHAEYARFRKLMTGDVNAAIRGACDAGAEEMVVADGHGNARNILIEELDPRARLNTGSPAPWAMVQGVDGGVSAAMFVGYHARAGSQNAILDHTWSSSSMAGVWLNGQVVGEIGCNAALCGHFDVPVILVSGDQTACAEAVELLGPIEIAVVKQASGRTAAECLPPEVAQREIYEAAHRAVNRLKERQTPPPLRLHTPITLTLELMRSDQADRAAILPGARRFAGRRIELTAEDVPAAYQLFRAAVALASA
jgi:D-amino peptidase